MAGAKQTRDREVAERDAFFDDTTIPVGPGSAFNNVEEIEAEASKLEGTAAKLEGSAAIEMAEAASALRTLAAEATNLEGDVTSAKDVLDSFFDNDGVGAEFDDEGALLSVISDLEEARVQALDKGALTFRPKRAWLRASSPLVLECSSMVKSRWIRLPLPCAERHSRRWSLRQHLQRLRKGS